jgi:UDP-N-acetylglucosamine 4-epimerase
MEIIGLRYFNVYGPRQNPAGDYAAVIPKFILNLLTNQTSIINGDGSYSRDFTYVDNVVDANISALTTNINTRQHSVFNIACGQRTSINELYQLLCRLTQRPADVNYGPPRVGDIETSVADIRRSKSALKYSPSVQLEQGLYYTIQYFKDYINETNNLWLHR